MSEKKHAGRVSKGIAHGRRGYWTRRARFRRIKRGLAKIGYKITPSIFFGCCPTCERLWPTYGLEIVSATHAGGRSRF